MLRMPDCVVRVRRRCDSLTGRLMRRPGLRPDPGFGPRDDDSGQEGLEDRRTGTGGQGRSGGLSGEM